MHRFSRARLLILVAAIASSQNSHFNSAWAQQPNRAPSPPQAAAGDKTQTAQQKQPDYSQEAFVIEQFRVSYRFESDGTAQREMSARIKIQSDAGVQTFGQLILPYNSSNEKLEIERVSVHKQD